MFKTLDTRSLDQRRKDHPDKKDPKEKDQREEKVASQDQEEVAVAEVAVAEAVSEDTTLKKSQDKVVKREDNNHPEVTSLTDHSEAEAEVSDPLQETTLTSNLKEDQ